jgi:hypothetical protein
MWFRVGKCVALAASLLAVVLAPSAALAALVTFDFDSMGYRSSSTPGSDSAVGTYLNGVWSGAGQAGAITVTGAGELSNNQYTGDGHVVGPSTCSHFNTQGACTSWTTTPATLGNTEGGAQDGVTVDPLSTQAPDNFIVNATTDRITITFPTPIYALSFDFEIFPDGTCPSASSCGRGQANLPDFSLWADGALQMQTFGAYPGTPGTFSHSTSSGHGHTEPAPQYLGHAGLIVLDEGATQISFVDWPQRIGIDNLVVDTQCEYLSCPRHDAPEPPMLPLVALGLGALGLCAARRRPCRRGSAT